MNISDIAKKAGVSTATVSRVLNNSTRVTPETRDRVQQIIDEQGYTPSAVARNLSVQNTRTVGVIVPDIENPFFYCALRGISLTAERHQYNVVFFNSDETASKEHKFLKIVCQQRLEGVVISPVDGYDALTRSTLEDFERQGIAVVLLDRTFADGCFSSVTAEDRKGAYEAVSRLIREGHRRIAIIEGSPSNRPVYERSLGYLQALREHGIPLREKYMVRADQKSDLAYQAAERLLALESPPTAIFTCNNQMTLGCLRCLTEHDLSIGKDVSLIGFDDIETLKAIDYHLSAVNRSEQRMGELAMELLLNHLKNPDAQRETAVVPTELILRGSEKYAPFPVPSRQTTPGQPLSSDSESIP